MKKILAFLLILILAAGGFVGYRYYPLYKTAVSMKDGLEFDFDYEADQEKIETMLTDGSSEIPAEALQILAKLQQGSVNGEYADGILHAYLYKDGIDVAIVEIYYDTKEEGEGKLLLNFGSLLGYTPANLDVFTSLIYSALQEKLSSMLNVFFSYDQLQQILSADTGSRVNVGDSIGALTGDSINIIKLYKVLKPAKVTVDTEDGLKADGLHLTLDVEEIPVAVSGNAWIMPAEHDRPAMPDFVKLSDDQINMFRTIVEYIQSAMN